MMTSTRCFRFGVAAFASSSGTGLSSWDRVELVVVPRGVEHRTAADEEAEVIVLEPAGVLNTGNVVDDKFGREDLRK
jgi:hypothetical protein